MYVVLGREELGLVERLVESRIRELHPEFRRCLDHRNEDELRRELEACERLLHRLHEAECDVSA
jgi:hypothetical protein